MEATLDLPQPLEGSRWPGRILTGLPVLFLAFDGVAKLAQAPQVAEASQRLGLPVDVAPALGVIRGRSRLHQRSLIVDGIAHDHDVVPVPERGHGVDDDHVETTIT